MVNPKATDSTNKSKAVGLPDEEINISPMVDSPQKIGIDKSPGQINSSKQVSRPHFISEEKPLAKKPERSLRNIITAIIVIAIIGIISIVGLVLAVKGTTQNSSQVQLAVDLGCAIFHTLKETGRWDLEPENISLNQTSPQNLNFYQALKPKLQPIMQKYNLTLDDLEEEREKQVLLMQADPTFKKDVTSALLKAKCIQN